MWECPNCKEVIKDKYRHCWNCGKPKPTGEVVEVIKATPPQPKIELQPEPKIEPPPPIKVEPEIIKSAVSENKPQIKDQSLYESDFLSEYKPSRADKSPSKLKTVIYLFLWLAAFVSTAVFAYLSYQKMDNFSRKIEGERQNLSNQKAQFVFPPKPQMRRGTVIEGNLKPKVLPLNLKDNEIESLVTYLPDDLRPTNLEEIKTLMWFDCQNSEVGRYTDGTTGYQERCKIYLVDRETAKFIGIQDFVGIMPSLSKEKDQGNSVGKVTSDKYISYLREKQPENERTAMESAFDSPNHHFFSKSEFIYALFLLGFLAAVGLGWLAYKIKFDWTAD